MIVVLAAAGAGKTYSSTQFNAPDWSLHAQRGVLLPQKEMAMAQGVAGKGYKMTENRKNILELLIDEGGALTSKEGRATALMHGLLKATSSIAALNQALKELENIGWITRDLQGKRTFEIEITPKGKQIYSDETGVDLTPKPTPEASTNGETASAAPEAEVEQKDGQDDSYNLERGLHAEDLPGDIDYDILMGVILKAALRGMEGPSNGELDYYKQQNETLTERLAALEAERDKYRGEAASAIAERDQLQKNLNIVMSKLDKAPKRGSDKIRDLLSPEEQRMLDGMMRTPPFRRGN